MKKVGSSKTISSTFILNIILVIFLLVTLFLTFYPKVNGVEGSFSDGLVSALCLIVSLGIIVLNRAIPENKR
jgi:hypothetical protein